MRLRTLVSLLLLAALLHLSACGFFIYPERRGQTGGQLDSTIVILDAAGLLFGIIPGVIAFAVDISSGAIYLPPGGKSSLEKHLKSSLGEAPSVYREVPLSEAGISPETLRASLEQQTGESISMEQLKLYRYDSLRPLPATL